MTFLTYLVAGCAIFALIGVIQIAALTAFIEIGHRLQARRIARRRQHVGYIDMRPFRHG